MSELQRNIMIFVENLLKEKGKTKRDLAKVLNIKENSINRTLKNPNIKLSILEKTADFLEFDIVDLFPKKEKNVIREIGSEYNSDSQAEVESKLIISNLSEMGNRNSKTIANLVQIVADNFPDKNTSF